jgi:hypothetical protein
MSRLLVQQACPICTIILHANAESSFFMSMLDFNVTMLHVHAAYLCCLSMLYIHAAYQCFLTMSPRCMSTLHIHAA